MNAAIDYAAEYDNSARVENSAQLIDNFVIDAAMFREHTASTSQLDLTYGHQPRNQLDIFWPDKRRRGPMVMFIHGGYWQRLDRSAFSHMARGMNAHGIAVAIPSYTLCPDISVGGIINEMRRACIMLYQTYGKHLTIVGHSAGGHLAACMMATNWPSIHADLPEDLVVSGLGISGIYDLVPLLETPINEALKLDKKAAVSTSPVHWMPDALHLFDAWVGSEESDEFHRQSKELSERWGMLGTPTEYVSLEGTNHFTVIHSLTDPKSAMVLRIEELVNHPELAPNLYGINGEEQTSIKEADGQSPQKEIANDLDTESPQTEQKPENIDPPEKPDSRRKTEVDSTTTEKIASKEKPQKQTTSRKRKAAVAKKAKPRNKV